MSSDTMVMIAEDGVKRPTFESGEDAGALAGGFAVKIARNALLSHHGGDEIAGHEDGVGFFAIDELDGVAEKDGLSEVVQVDVTDLRDAHAVKSGGEPEKSDIVASDLNPVALNFAGIEGEAGSATEARLEK